MGNYRYTLEPYKGRGSRYTCPCCGKHKTFTRYIDSETGEHLAENVGKCSREIKCTYHYTPKQFFETNRPFFENLKKPEVGNRQMLTNVNLSSIVKPISFIPVGLFRQSLREHDTNNFVQFLVSLFGEDLTGKAISRYFIGTSAHWPGANVFWQIDAAGRVRTGKIMLYSPTTGKRVKEPYKHINWVHSVLNLPEFHLQQCLFGEHLLKAEPAKPCAIVESEKTAVIASLYLPQFVWLACGSLTNLTVDRCQVLSGRKVTLFPDLNAFNRWNTKAKELACIASIAVSELLERKATDRERAEGLDLADYLIRYSVQDFQLDPLHLHSADITDLLGQTRTGKEFNNIIIAGIKTKAGYYYDLLFNEEGELISPGLQPETVSRLAAFFEKELQPAFFDETPCLIHTVNNKSYE